MSNFHFSNLLGATYRGGNVQFTADGNVLLSAVGNRICAVDLVQGRTVTLAPENRQDIGLLALHPDGRLILSIDRAGAALVINLVRGCILNRINFKSKVLCARWSPNGAWLAISHGKKIQFWRAPAIDLSWQFVQHRVQS